MITFRYGNSVTGRERVSNYISVGNIHGKFEVLDIGASDDLWSRPDAILDIHKKDFRGRMFIGNINNTEDWLEVLDYVNERGKFDFSICSHTLEDIAYPALTLEMLPRISHAGYIASPSHYRELSRGLEYNSQYRGYFHHRWILAPDQDVLTVVPKISALEYLQIEGDPNDDKSELQIWWENELPFKVFNNDYLGPNQPTIIELYKEFFRRINDAI